MKKMIAISSADENCRICKNSRFLFILFFLILVFSLVYSVEAFGLSMSYNDNDRPLVLKPGENKEIDFALLSSSTESLKKIRLDIVEGMEIASLEKSEFELPREGEVTGYINMQIPNAIESLKKEYLITLLVREIDSLEETGTVGFSFSSKVSFIVKIMENEEKTKESGNNFYAILTIILVISILFLIIIIYAVLKRKRFKNMEDSWKKRKFR